MLFCICLFRIHDKDIFILGVILKVCHNFIKIEVAYNMHGFLVKIVSAFVRVDVVQINVVNKCLALY